MTTKLQHRLSRKDISIPAISQQNLYDAYVFFYDKYTESLFAPYTHPEINKLNNANFQGDTKEEIDKSKRVQYYLDLLQKNIFEDNNYYLYDLIYNCLKFKNSSYGFEKKVTLIDCHGEPTFNVAIVPEECVICFLTPLCYLSLHGIIDDYTYTKFLLDVNTPTKFYENPFCLDKIYKSDSRFTPYDNNLEKYKIFFSGQYYNDILLSDYDDTKDLGIYYTNGIDSLPQKLNGNKLLSLILSEQKLKGIIFIQACRDFDTNSNKNSNVAERYELTRNFVIYEHMLNILNRSAWYYKNQKNYYKCKYFKQNNVVNYTVRRKALKSTNKSVRNSISREYVLLRKKNNKGLGTKLPEILDELGLSHVLASKLFANIGKYRDLVTLPDNLLKLFTYIHNILFNSETQYNAELFRRLHMIGLNKKIKDMQQFAYKKYTESENTDDTQLCDPINLLISFVLYKLITSVDDIQQTEQEFYKSLWYYIKNNNQIKIYLSYCNLTTEQITKLLNYLSKDRTYYIYINGNRQFIKAAENDHIFCPVMYEKKEDSISSSLSFRRDIFNLSDTCASLGLTSKLLNTLLEFSENYMEFINTPLKLIRIFITLHNIFFNKEESYKLEMFIAKLSLLYTNLIKHLILIKCVYLMNLLISFFVYKLISSSEQSEQLFYKRCLTIICANYTLNKYVNIYLSYCDLTLDQIHQIDELLKLFTDEVVFYIYLNGNRILVDNVEDDKYFFDLKYNKLDHINFFEQMQLQVKFHKIGKKLHITKYMSDILYDNIGNFKELITTQTKLLSIFDKLHRELLIQKRSSKTLLLTFNHEITNNNVSKLREFVEYSATLYGSLFPLNDASLFCKPISLLISFILYKLITYQAVKPSPDEYNSNDEYNTLSDYNFYIQIWNNFNKLYNYDILEIYLSYCNLTQEQIDKLLKLLIKGKTYHIYINNNPALVKEEEHFFTPAKFVKKDDDITFEIFKKQILTHELSQVAGYRKKTLKYKYKHKHMYKINKYLTQLH